MKAPIEVYHVTYRYEDSLGVNEVRVAMFDDSSDLEEWLFRAASSATHPGTPTLTIQRILRSLTMWESLSYRLEGRLELGGMDVGAGESSIGSVSADGVATTDVDGHATSVLG